MRVFFAIELEEEIKKYLEIVQSEVRKKSIAGNYTIKDNFHLTLRFIGEQTQSQVEQLQSVLKEASDALKTFKLRLSKIGYFPKGNRKIIWIGLENSQELEDIYSKMENILERYGYTKESRSYSPHITLAREVKIDNSRFHENQIQVENLEINVNSVSLMESKRIDNKLCYVHIDRIKIGDGSHFYFW